MVYLYILKLIVFFYKARPIFKTVSSLKIRILIGCKYKESEVVVCFAIPELKK